MTLSRRRERILGRLRSRRSREREGLFLVEGVRGVAEALEAGAEIRYAVVSPGLESTEAGVALLGRLEAAGVEPDRVEDARLEELSDTRTPQGLVVACREPDWSFADLDPDRGLLVLDGVQDPGNAGTLIRAAAAFALGGVVALDGTVDPWNPKAVRASAGGIFRQRCVRLAWDAAGSALETAGVRILVADAGGRDVRRVRPGPRWALAVGNEGGGIRPGLRAAAEAVVGVPMPGGTESLNAGMAGCILLFSLAGSFRSSGSH